ncbi:hypothetical protein VTN02DRAFT_5860 [Thermoascus thermophilus]
MAEPGSSNAVTVSDWSIRVLPRVGGYCLACLEAISEAVTTTTTASDTEASSMICCTSIPSQSLRFHSGVTGLPRVKTVYQARVIDVLCPPRLAYPQVPA